MSPISHPNQFFDESKKVYEGETKPSKYPEPPGNCKFGNSAKVLFSRNFSDVKFRENETLGKCQNHSVVY